MPRNLKPCSVNGCERPVNAKGLCMTHYRHRRRATGENHDCSVVGCTSESVAKGLCGKHYRRLRLYGDVDTLSASTALGAPMAFLEAALNADTQECILWPFAVDTRGYGAVKWKGRQRQAHRVSLILATGEDRPAEFDARHAPLACHNRLCINPAHLMWGSRQDNMEDRDVDGSTARGERNGQSKLTEEQVRAIRSDDRAARLVAADFGIHKQTVIGIRARKRWAHVE